MKLDQAKKDVYRRMAKKEGYRSRAAFKLAQIDRKYKVFKPGQVVIDFGCAPGGWLQYISKAIGDEGFALGVDLKPLGYISKNVDTIVADVKDKDTRDRIVKRLPRRADVVTSDLSPSISGIWELDVSRQMDLISRVCELFPSILKEGGDTIIKVFQGNDLNEFLKNIRKNFKEVTTVKPPASRQESSELYLLCKGFTMSIS